MYLQHLMEIPMKFCFCLDRAKWANVEASFFATFSLDSTFDKPTKSFCLRYWISNKTEIKPRNKRKKKKWEEKCLVRFLVSLFVDMIYLARLAELITWYLKWINGRWLNKTAEVHHFNYSMAPFQAWLIILWN